MSNYEKSVRDREYLLNLQAACPGAGADFILRHFEDSSSAINVAQNEWVHILAAENVELRSKVGELEEQLAGRGPYLASVEAAQADTRVLEEPPSNRDLSVQLPAPFTLPIAVGSDADCVEAIS